METDLTWITIPSGNDTDGNGVFASSQYWYEAYDQPCPNSSAHGMACNSAGYMGTQVMPRCTLSHHHTFIIEWYYWVLLTLSSDTVLALPAT